jgi:hypothetical protein
VDDVRVSPEAAILTERLSALFTKGERANAAESPP